MKKGKYQPIKQSVPKSKNRQSVVALIALIESVQTTQSDEEKQENIQNMELESAAARRNKHCRSRARRGFRF